MVIEMSGVMKGRKLKVDLGFKLGEAETPKEREGCDVMRFGVEMVVWKLFL